MTKEASTDFTNFAQFEPGKYKPEVKNGVILEIGPGKTPVYTFSEEVLRRLEDNVMYVAIDHFSSELTPKSYRIGDCVVGDLVGLPIKSGLAEQVWLMNVFGGGDRRRRDISAERLYNCFFSELARVLKPGGMVIIGENNTPEKWLRDKDYRKFGLERKVFIRKKDLEEFIEKYRMTGSVANLCESCWEEEPFFMILTKAR